MLTTLPVEIVGAKPAVRRQQLRELVPLSDTIIYITRAARPSRCSAKGGDRCR